MPDRFEDAARAEAERRSPFEGGALWARDPLPEQKLTDAEVEALTISISRRRYLMKEQER